jgi:hypothetical protein
LLKTNRKGFAGCELVYLQKFKRWVSHDTCVWDGPELLTFARKLSSEYPLCRSLFQSRLLLTDATIKDVIYELQRVTISTSLHTLQQLLLLLNRHLTLLSTPHDYLSELKGKKIIPVTTRDGERRMNYNKNIWYFADRQSLWDRFHGKIPLISFDVKTVRKLKQLIDAMELSEYFLSAAVESKLDLVGLKIADKERTDDLRERARYLVQ